MPIPLIPAIAAGASILNTISGVMTNNNQMNYSREMYDRQRADALADWNMQNEYNAPINQMKRFRDAGLNPNLIYGQTNTAAPVRSTDFKSANLTPPSLDTGALGSSLLQAADLKYKDTQTGVAQQAIELSKAQVENVRANTLRTLKDTDLKAFDLVKNQMLLDYDVDMMKEKLLNLRASTSLQLGENERKWLQSAPSIEETLARVNEIKARTEKVPYEKRLLEANAENVRSMSVWRSISEPQRVALNKALTESALMRSILTNKQISGTELQNSLLDIKTKFKELGLSETVTSDIIKMISSTLMKP